VLLLRHHGWLKGRRQEAQDASSHTAAP